MENIYILEIRERIPFGKKKVSRENREAIVKEEKGKRQSKRKKVGEEKSLELRDFAGLTQVRGVYRRLMGIMG